MLPTSEFTITLGTSSDYVRCAILLHVVAALVLLRSALPVFVMVFFMLVLISALLRVIYTRIPLPKYQKLSRHTGYWILHEVSGRQTKYEQVSIGFEGGIFILLRLTGNHHKTVLAVFKDQLTVDQSRVLSFMTRKAT